MQGPPWASHRLKQARASTTEVRWHPPRRGRRTGRPLCTPAERDTVGGAASPTARAPRYPAGNGRQGERPTVDPVHFGGGGKVQSKRTQQHTRCACEHVGRRTLSKEWPKDLARHWQRSLRALPMRRSTATHFISRWEKTGTILHRPQERRTSLETTQLRRGKRTHGAVFFGGGFSMFLFSFFFPNPWDRSATTQVPAPGAHRWDPRLGTR